MNEVNQEKEQLIQGLVTDKTRLIARCEMLETRLAVVREALQRIADQAALIEGLRKFQRDLVALAEAGKEE